MAEQKKIDWKNTLNLPRTDFPMKAQLNQKEPQILNQWQEDGIYELILKKRAGRPLYILHDGPPYANGNIHLGTGMNKILKDIVVKSKSMAGFQAPYVPGWDCHGLPIEHKVDQLLGERKQRMSVVQVRQECRRYAEKFIDLHRTDFKRLGVFGDWQHPYTTLDHDYEAGVIRFFNSFVRNGSVYRKKRPVYWCSSCQTALAEAEVEYHNHTSPSITVKFQLRELPSSLKKFSDQPVFALIWTTTPWTIPANLAIAAHPEYDYALFEIGGQRYIAASRLVPVIADLVKSGYRKLAEFKGRELAGLQATHPLYDRPSLLINTDYVLLDQGTGLVHTAPGHGEEDYQAGVVHGLDIYSPVGPDGRFDETTGPYAGHFIFDANDEIVRDLRQKQRLLHVDSLEHSYPHCWRCKNPVIFRATEQWFIAVDNAGLRAKALAAIRQVKWIPSWGEERITTMIANRPDWCISRQRDWGVPLPVFFCRSCSRALLDAAVIDQVERVFAAHGSDSWYEKEAGEFLPAKTICPHCGGKDFDKGMDILDVWFESGSSHGILERTAGHQWPADLYLEGGDQFRGWFHSSLLVGLSARGASPYRAVITHGWTLDAEGRAMSKSLGNTIEPADVAREQGAEILRLWVAMVNYQEDVWFGDEMVARITESYRKIRNTWRFMLGVLADFDPQRDAVASEQFQELDRFILLRLQQVKERVLTAYQDFEFHAISHAIFNFFTVDLSAFYLNIQKDNLYCNATGSLSRRAAQTAVFTLLVETLQLMAPILSYTCEEAWGFVPSFPGKESSVHLQLFPSVDPQFSAAVDIKKWDSLRLVRDRTLKEIEEARGQKKIGDSLEAEVEIEADGEELALLEKNRPLLKEMLVVAALTVRPGRQGGRIRITKSQAKKCPRCWNRFAEDTSANTHSDLCPRCSRVAGETDENGQK